jgi:hypothetical protein
MGADAALAGALPAIAGTAVDATSVLPEQPQSAKTTSIGVIFKRSGEVFIVILYLSRLHFGYDAPTGAFTQVGQKIIIVPLNDWFGY